ncbi:MAG TPA: VTT domain-containing protein [Thermoanaerobaculia bacterium]|nr:VTT domain-containing protein [Thermoanaerobaculia bacterium]
MVPQSHLPHLRKRLVVAAALLAIAGWIAASDAPRQWMNEILTAVEGTVRRHPNAGMLTFIALAAASAILAFFSSAVVVPVGVKAWGETWTFVLLWIGWLLGGALTYAVGRYLGRGTIRLLVSEDRVAWYEERVGRRVGFSTVLLFQLALPSEIPGYVLGTLRYPFTRYLLALAIAELPFAIGATYLGWTFLRGSYILLLIAGAAGIAISAAALHHFHARIRA